MSYGNSVESSRTEFPRKESLRQNPHGQNSPKGMTKVYHRFSCLSYVLALVSAGRTGVIASGHVIGQTGER